MYNKNGIYRCIRIFLIFDPKHRLGILDRESPRRSGSYVFPQSKFGAKILKISFSRENFNLKTLEKMYERVGLAYFGYLSVHNSARLPACQPSFVSLPA